ncbi:MAG: hypothetical protein Q9201_004867 [Fulgogasparrea decipioides]
MEGPSLDANSEKKQPLHAETEVLSEAERDVQALARLGKKPILKWIGEFLCLSADYLSADQDDSVFTFGLTKYVLRKQCFRALN